MIDTVDLYFLKDRQRKLSLRFLSWFVLGENIQMETHDSIEDARSALMLYKAYHEFEEQNIFDEKLEELYREGRRYVCLLSPPPSCTFAHFDLRVCRISSPLPLLVPRLLRLPHLNNLLCRLVLRRGALPSKSTLQMHSIFCNLNTAFHETIAIPRGILLCRISSILLTSNPGFFNISSIPNSNNNSLGGLIDNNASLPFILFFLFCLPM